MSKLFKTKVLKNGFSLLEVLIAVLIIAFGLLGMAALQLKTVQNSHSAYQRTVASVIAMDAAERLWINLALKEDIDTVVLSAWRNDWSDSLPNQGSDMTIGCINNRCNISVSWIENRFSSSNQLDADGNPINTKSTFSYVIDLY